MVRSIQSFLFQSLFFWMLLSKAHRSDSTAQQPACFNPYFSGCFSLSAGDGATGGYYRGFQSLFFWMLLSKFFVIFCAIVILLPVFQSLFFWMLLSKVVCEKCGWATQEFQSLFFWMLLSKMCGHTSVCWMRARVSILIFLDASL